MRENVIVSEKFLVEMKPLSLSRQSFERERRKREKRVEEKVREKSWHLLDLFPSFRTEIT